MNALKILRLALIVTAAVTSLNTYADIHRYQYEGGSLIGPKIFYGETQQNFNYGAFKLFAEFDDSLTPGINLLSNATVWYMTRGDQYFAGIAPGYDVGWIETNENHEVVNWSFDNQFTNVGYISSWSSNPSGDAFYYKAADIHPNGDEIIYMLLQGSSPTSGNWTVTTVPEPAIMNIALAGFLMVAAVAYRRQG